MDRIDKLYMYLYRKKEIIYVIYHKFSYCMPIYFLSYFLKQDKVHSSD